MLAVKLGDKYAVGVLLELGAKVIGLGVMLMHGEYIVWTAAFSTSGATGILEMLLQNIQEDRETPTEDKRKVISALKIASQKRMIAAEQLLRQELKLYPEDESDDDFH